jgi:hypothetical protein
MSLQWDVDPTSAFVLLQIVRNLIVWALNRMLIPPTFSTHPYERIEGAHCHVTRVDDEFEREQLETLESVPRA